jgi:hypothetical protein
LDALLPLPPQPATASASTPTAAVVRRIEVLAIVVSWSVMHLTGLSRTKAPSPHEAAGGESVEGASVAPGPPT